jgi:hypothetical protein
VEGNSQNELGIQIVEQEDDTMTQARKGLGRGLSALIPTDDMEFLSQVARGDFSILGGDQPLEAKT